MLFVIASPRQNLSNRPVDPPRKNGTGLFQSAGLDRTKERLFDPVFFCFKRTREIDDRPCKHRRPCIR